MRTGCGCREISRGPIEFKIHDTPQVHINCGPLLPSNNSEDYCKLQQKIICDVLKVIKQLECGIQPDIEIILEEISLIFMKSCGYNVAKKMYSTDIEEDYFLRHNNFLSEFESLEEKDLVLMNLGIYGKMQSMVTRDDLDIDLSKKIGFVVHIGKEYCGFASDLHYGKWLENGDDALILGRWIAGDYVPGEYTVVFNNMGGDPVDPITKNEGFPFIFPMPTWNNDPTRHFLGWFTNYNQNTEEFSGDCYAAGSRLIPTLGMVFYAKWVKELKILTFNYNYNGSPQEPYRIPENTFLGETFNFDSVELPIREGYIFNSWNTKQDGTGRNYGAGESYKIEDNQSFYALWSPISYTISFNGNGSTSGEMRNLILTYDEEVSLTSNIFARTGYTFAGWDILSNGDNVTYTDKLSVVNLTTLANSTIQLYARWTPITYNITYVLNGGTISTNKETYTIEDTITLDNPTKTGYGFVGWYNNEDYTGSTIVNIPSGSYGDKIFYAKWAIDIYTITFNDGVDDISTINVEYNTLLSSITYPSVSKEYYNLTGWNINLNGSGTNPTKVASDITLYALWTPIVYNINYQLDGGTLNTTKNTYTIESNTITLDNPTKTGHTFKGWYDNANYTGSTVTSIAENSHGDKTFYAKWLINTYTITFVYNNGTNNLSSTTVNYNTLWSSIELPSISYEGYKLTGWKDSNGNNPPTRISSNITLYAQWELKNQYYLTTTMPTSIPEWSISSGEPTLLQYLIGWNEWKGNRTQYIVFPYKDSDNVSDYFEHIESLTQSSFSDMYEKENSSISEIIIFRFRIERTRQPLGDGNMTDIIKIK